MVTEKEKPKHEKINVLSTELTLKKLILGLFKTSNKNFIGWIPLRLKMKKLLNILLAIENQLTVRMLFTRFSLLFLTLTYPLVLFIVHTPSFFI